jgi:hypothetical protein
MTVTLTTGNARFLVTEDAGIITAATAEGVPNPDACARNMIGQRFAVWMGRMEEKRVTTARFPTRSQEAHSD